MLLQKSFKEPFLGKCFLGPSMNAETAAIWYHIHNKKVKSGTSYSPRIEENEGEISVSQREIVTTWSDELL
jgi:hypothetical protein